MSLSQDERPERACFLTYNFTLPPLPHSPKRVSSRRPLLLMYYYSDGPTYSFPPTHGIKYTLTLPVRGKATTAAEVCVLMSNIITGRVKEIIGDAPYSQVEPISRVPPSTNTDQVCANEVTMNVVSGRYIRSHSLSLNRAYSRPTQLTKLSTTCILAIKLSYSWRLGLPRRRSFVLYRQFRRATHRTRSSISFRNHSRGVSVR
jgi:hypothetical protein